MILHLLAGHGVVRAQLGFHMRVEEVGGLLDHEGEKGEDGDDGDEASDIGAFGKVFGNLLVDVELADC